MNLKFRKVRTALMPNIEVPYFEKYNFLTLSNSYMCKYCFYNNQCLKFKNERNSIIIHTEG